jgi:hypothetical protein
MGDTLITIIAIFLAAVLLFVFPMLAISERNDDVAQLQVQVAAEEFINETTNKGNMTQTNYEKFLSRLMATGNSYDVEMEVQILDENPGKKTTWTSTDKIGENLYYSVYTTQIEEQLAKGKYVLKEGDIVTIKVKNTNLTLSQMFKNFFYRISGNNTAQIAADFTGVVSANGNS